MEICIYDRKQILQVHYALKDFLKSFITFRLLNGDMVFSRKTKVSCYKNEVNESVMLHAVFFKWYRFTVFDKNTKVSCNKQKYRVSVRKKLATK